MDGSFWRSKARMAIVIVPLSCPRPLPIDLCPDRCLFLCEPEKSSLVLSDPNRRSRASFPAHLQLHSGAVNLPGRARSHALFRDCPSTSCLLHCSNAQIPRGCGIVYHRVLDRRTSSKADHEPELLRGGSCLHSRCPRDSAIPRLENRIPLNRWPRRQAT